ncbi:MAG TPA: hypothetical protein VIJ42_11835 [Stellaceae bacterium]
MIALDGITLHDEGRVILDRVSVTFGPGMWHLAAAPARDARVLLHLLAGQQAPFGGTVRCRGARSWLLGQFAPFGLHLRGLDIIDTLCSLYALERRGTFRLFHDLLEQPEWLAVRFDRWPRALQRQFGHIAFIAPAFDNYLLDVSPVLPQPDFYRRWRILFGARVAGKTVIIASGEHRAALHDFPGERMTLGAGRLHAAGDAPAMAAE